MLFGMSTETQRADVPLERWLDALAGIGEAVGGDEPVTDLLNRVARTACTLLGYDFCAVLLPDESGLALTIVGSHGLSPDYIAQVNAERPILLAVHGDEEAPTNVAFRTGEVVALEDIEAVPGIGPWGGVAHEQGYRALVSVPLRRSGRVVGALNGYHAAPHRFDHAEISLVNAMATQVAIALGTAQLRAREQDTIRELRRAEEVHALLTATALRREGVAGVAAALAELLGRDVLIEDVYGETLGGTGDGPASTVSDFELGGGSVIAGPQNASVAGVVLDGKVVARIHIAAPRTELTRLDVRAAEHAAVVTALELLRARTAAEVEQRLRGSLVADLLSTDDADVEALLDRARRLGWDLSGEQHLVAVRCVAPRGSGDGRGERPATDRLLAAADRLVARISPRPLAAIYRDDLVLIWSGAAGDVADFAGRLVELLTSTDAVAHAFAGVTAAEEPSALSALFRTLRGALDLAADTGGTGVTDLREVAIDHLLLQLDDPGALRAFARSTLGAALDYDHEHDTELLRTVRVLLDHDLDRRAAAGALHLHPNTVAQRVRRLESLTGLRLGRPRDLLRLTSALTVARIAGLG